MGTYLDGRCREQVARGRCYQDAELDDDRCYYHKKIRDGLCEKGDTNWVELEEEE